MLNSIRPALTVLPALTLATRIAITGGAGFLAALPIQAGPRILNFMAIVEETNYHPDAHVASKVLFDSIAKARQWTLVHSKNPGLFTDTGLARYDAIIFNNTAGRIFDAAQKQALEGFIHKGGGIAGIHSASYMHKMPGEWPWWEDAVGALHVSGPPQRGYVGPGANTITLRDSTRRFAEGLPQTWVIPEVEWYKYGRDLPTGIHVLATAEPQKEMAGYPAYYPVSWCHHFDGGRSWYSNMGHFASEFHDPNFLRHLVTGVEWSADRQAGGCGTADPLVVLFQPRKPERGSRFSRTFPWAGRVSDAVGRARAATASPPGLSGSGTQSGNP